MADNRVNELVTSLWEKITIACATITSLQEENKQLKSNLEQLNSNISNLNNTLILKDVEIKKLRDHLFDANQKISTSTFLSEDEKIKIRTEIEDVLEKLNQYITT